MAQTKEKLLRELETVNYKERVRRLYQIGKDASELAADVRKRDETRRLIEALSKGGFYERQLALLSCNGSRDKVKVAAFVNDPSQLLRNYALKLVPRVCDDEQIAAIFAELDERCQREMLKMLRRLRRFALVDRLIETLLSGSPGKLLNAFFFAGEQFVEKHFHLIADALGAQQMSRFAYQYPKRAAAYLIDLAKLATSNDPRLRWLTNGALSTISRLAPDNGVEVVAEVVRTIPPESLSLHATVKFRPNETVRAMDAAAVLAGFRLPANLGKVSTDSLLRLLETNALNSSHQYLFRKISTETASAIYHTVSDGWRDNDGCLSTIFLDRLPQTDRVQEARRHLANPLIAANQEKKFQYVRYLPWQEAVETVRILIDSPDVEGRAMAFSNLIPAIRFHRQDKNQLLDMMVKRKNEPDPVRLAIMSAVRELPPSIWSKEDENDLNVWITKTLAAVDLSSSTLSELASFLVRVFPSLPDWAGRWTAKILKNRGCVLSRGWPDRTPALSKAELKLFSSHITDALKYWVEREHTNHIISLAAWYQRRTCEFPELVAALIAVVKQVRNEHSAVSAAQILQNFAPRNFAEIVPELLKKDKSWSTQYVIYSFLHRHRQDLLTPYLGQTLHTGKLYRGRTRQIPTFTAGFYRWTAEQQGIYTKELIAMTSEKPAAVHNRLVGADTLVLLPEPPMDVLRKLTRADITDEAEVIVRDYLLSHLGNLDAGQGIPVLLECLNDERARIAVYALRNIQKVLPASQVFNALSQAPGQQVTVAKEIVRLIGEAKTQQSHQWLIAEWSQELQKDVRTAVLRALWNYTDQDQTWQIFDEAVSSGVQAQIDTVLRLPADGLSSAYRDRLLNLYGKALSAGDAPTRLMVLGYTRTLPILDQNQILLEPMIQCIRSASTNESNRAAHAALQLYSNLEGTVMQRIVRSIRDEKRGLTEFLNVFCGSSRGSQATRMHDVRMVADTLGEDPQLLTWQIRIAGLALPWKEFGDLLRALQSSGRLHADAMRSAELAFGSISQRQDEQELENLEEDLAMDQSAQIRRLGLAALAALGNSNTGWTPARLARLNKYRSDESLLVSSAAEFTLPANELLPALA